jgi:hypothetical protein
MLGEGRFRGNSRIAYVLGGLVLFVELKFFLVCFEQTKTIPILPLRTAADLREGDSRSLTTKVSSMDNPDAHASTHETAQHQVRPPPFVGESERESFEELSCFAPDQTVSGDDKRDEVLTTLQAGL